jgi:hypothetical protein
VAVFPAKPDAEIDAVAAAPGLACWLDPMTQAEILRGVADAVNSEWNP